MTKEELTLEVIRRLKVAYPLAECTLDYDQAWKLLVSVRLAAQCTDARVNIVVQDLFAKYPSVAALAAAEPEEIEAIEAGIRDDKATNLQTYKKEILETLNGAVILRYSYAEGVTEHTLTEDKEVHRAVALLDDGAEYARILHEQDTVRK
mgnify:CR=1 FL=1